MTDSMATMQIYDLNEILPSPFPEPYNQMLSELSPAQSFISSDLSSSIPFVQTPASIQPANHNGSCSPPQSIILSDIFPFDVFNDSSDGNDHKLHTIFDDLGTSSPTNDYQEVTHMNNGSTHPLSNASSSDFDEEKLVLLAEPRAFFRARYESEVDRIKNRAQRYIRTEDGTRKYDHPTVKIPLKWRDPTRQYYIRVTLVTIKPKKTSVHFIHPYKIDTLENHVLRDEYKNSLFFPINANDINTGEKSFSIGLTKKIQTELKSYGPLRPYDPNDEHHVRNIQDPKQIIYQYQLNKSQLIFTVVELQDNNTKVLSYDHTAVETRVMTDNSETSFADSCSERSAMPIKCIPSKGSWQGNEEIVIIMPHSIKKKDYLIWFDFGNDMKQTIESIQHIDTKTILFQTPPCPYLPGNDDIKVTIHIQENHATPIVIDFDYITPIKTIINVCPKCSEYGMNCSSNKKRAWQFDTGDILAKEMSELSIREANSINTHVSSSQSNSSSHKSKQAAKIIEENNFKFDKYLNQLKDALELFVRRNDPSRLLRRTRVLLAKYTVQPSPLHEAIENGHRQLALALIEQIIDIPSPNRLLEDCDEHGQTPVLIAAKLNEKDILELILKQRSDLISQKDHQGNNLFHFLADFKDDQAAETIKTILTIFPNDVRLLLKEENQNHQTPMMIAQSNGNEISLELLTHFLNSEEKCQ